MLQKNREIRVFISSTFSDMREERKYLNNNIFPELRRLCEQRSVVFTEVDLQWGIDEQEAKQGGAVEICLEEINRCQPYFIGMLGERYGWSPQDDGLKVRKPEQTYDDAEEKLLISLGNESLRKPVHEWVEEGESVTAMEIIHGVLESDEQAEFSFFYFRDPTYTEQLLQSAQAESHQVQEAAFIETDEAKKKKLVDLKARILRKEKPWHVQIFPSETAPEINNGYTNVEQLGNQIREDLLGVINEKFSEDKKPSALEKESRFHAAFAQSRLQSYIPDEACFNKINTHFNTSRSPLVISGEMGSGKSALLANFADRWRKGRSSGLVIEHYAGSGGEADVLGVLRRIMLEIKHVYKVDEDIPSQPDDIFQNFASWLFYADKPLLLVLDGINQLQGDLTRFLYAFPANLNEHVHIIFSSLDGEVLDMATKREWHIQYVQALTPEQKNTLVVAYLKQYHKSLAEDLVDKLVHSTMGDNPLFLRVVMDELRVDATHDQLEAMLDGYLQAKDLVQLFDKVLSRCERVYPKSNVHVIMALIYTSRYGLSESELREICDQSSNHPVAPLYISQLIFGLGGYLADREGLYGFMHDALRIAVKKKYIQPDVGIERRKEIAAYFVKKDLSQRQLDELPWQWSKLLNHDSSVQEELKDYLSHLVVMAIFSCREQWEAEVLGYWQLAQCDPSNMLKHYQEQIEGTLDAETKGYLLFLLGQFYQYIGLNEHSEELYSKSLSIRQDIFACEHMDVMMSRNSLALILQSLGKYDESLVLCHKSLESAYKVFGDQHPDIMPLLNNLARNYQLQGDFVKAKYLYDEALKLARNSFGEKHIAVVACLNNIGDLLGSLGKYDEAETVIQDSLQIRRELNRSPSPNLAISLNNLASILNLKGEPIEAQRVYEESLTVFRGVFGNNHPSVAMSLNNLAGTFESLGKYKEAENIYIESLSIQRHLLNSNHPDLATTLSNLSMALATQGHYSKAEPLARESLSIRKALFGYNHPDLADSLNNLALILNALGQPIKSKNLYENSLRMYCSFYGDIHPRVAVNQINLASVLCSLTEYTEAEELYQKSLITFVKLFGGNHPQISAALVGLIDLLKLEKPNIDCDVLYKRIVAICRDVVGENQDDIMGMINNLALILHSQGQYSELDSLYKEVLEMQRVSFGNNDERVAYTLYNRAKALMHQKKYANAEVMLRESLKINRILFGDLHPSVAVTFGEIALCLESNGNYSDAESLYRESLRIGRILFDDRSAELITSLNNLAMCIDSQGRDNEAELLYRESLAMAYQLFDESHPEVTTVLNNLIQLLLLQGKHDEIKTLRQGSE